MGSRLEKNSNDVRKRIESHTFDDEGGEEYEASKFGGFSDYMRRKKIKLQNLDAELRSQSIGQPQIFRGIVAHVNGYTQPSLSDLHKLIVAHGGGFLQYLDGKTAVTHVIASHLTPKKKVEFARYRIVKPAWIVDSVKAGKLLPWDGYRVVDEGVTQKVLGFDNGQVVSQVSNHTQGYRDESKNSWYTSQMRNVAGGDKNSIVDKSSVDHAADNVQDGAADSERGSAPQDLGASFVTAVNTRNTPIASATALGQISEVPNLADSPAAYTSNDMDIERPAPDPVEPRVLTAEEHNAILLQNPHLAKSSTANPDFIQQYYRESRLHHLSAWKAELKAQLQARALQKSSQTPKQKRSPGSRWYIMHVDFDSFFAAVSLRKNAHLKDKPVVIAHGSGPGSEIASCNYPARKYGIKNGMWMKYALEMCPDLKVLPYDFKAYEEASKHFYDSILAMEGTVQSISIDEALIDVSESCTRASGSNSNNNAEDSVYREQTRAEELASLLRKSVKEKTECDVSVGIGNNILLAKVALRKAKPAGQYLVKPEEVLEFIGGLEVTDLPGVARSIGNKLEEIGVKLVKDIRSLTKERMMNVLGPKTGEKLWEYSRGIDKQEVGEQVIRKSVSAEVNWGIRFVTQQQAEDFVYSLCEELSKRLLEQSVKGKQLTMKIMRKAADAGMDPPKNLGHGKCDTFNKSIVLGVTTNDKAVIGKEAISILRGYGFSPGELRGLGVQMQKLEPLKPLPNNISTSLDSSQRRLQFKKPSLPSTVSRMDSPTMTKASTMSPSVFKHDHRISDSDASVFRSDKPNTEQIPTEDIHNPETPSTPSEVIHRIDELQEDHAPLNISGTQFLMPTQVDPEVLAELPAEIRSKFAPRQQHIFQAAKRSQSPQLQDIKRSASPYCSDSDVGLPNASQLDPQTLAELPEDVKEELMAHYRNTNKQGAGQRTQQVLPQSPRKNRPLLQSKKLNLTPTKKQKTFSLASKGRSKASDALSTLTQSNFVSMGQTSAVSVDTSEQSDEISMSFLEQLPDDIRQELLAEQKRNRMKTKSGLNVNNQKKRKKPDEGGMEAMRGQQKLFMPGRRERPSFTSKKLTELPDLRNAMSAWVQEFSEQSEDGPYQEDADALAHYLHRVVLEEADMAKAVAVISWLEYLVEDWPFTQGHIRSAWERIVTSLKLKVQDAMQQRNLPPLVFT